MHTITRLGGYNGNLVELIARYSQGFSRIDGIDVEKYLLFLDEEAGLYSVIVSRLKNSGDGNNITVNVRGPRPEKLIGLVDDVRKAMGIELEDMGGASREVDLGLVRRLA